VAKEKQVVKNEKRQSVDNRPYGHMSYAIDNALYPEGHPYRWQVIGSLADLDSATLADVKDFHSKWYGPNNATLVVAGDIDVDEAKAWIEKYFGEIPARETPDVPTPPAVALAESVRLFHEDNFARLPQLRLVWPSTPQFHEDSYALSVLADLLTDGKSTPFYEVLVEEKKVAPGVFAFDSADELAGQFMLAAQAFAGTDLDAVHAAMQEAFQRFEKEGVDPLELERVKAGTETAFYRGTSSTLGKSFSLAQYAIFADSVDYFKEDLERTLAVSAEDVVRVYEKYIKDRPFVAASFVPKGQAELVLAESTRAEVVEEKIVAGAEKEVVVQRGEERSPQGAFDRSVEPPFGDPPSARVPDVWRETLANGVQVLGIEDRETPLVQFELRLAGGQLLEDPSRVGVANLLAETLAQGTKNRTPAELERAIDLLGASISVNSGSESFVISASTVARNYAETIALVEEILLEPRWDEEEFVLARTRVEQALRQRSANPNAVASDVFQRLLYGDHILGRNPLGTIESVQAMEQTQLKAFYAKALVPGLASFHVAGAVSQADVEASLKGLAERWTGESPKLPAAPKWSAERAKLYFVDVPDSKQSVLNIGYLALAETDDDYYPATVMNFRLGGGGFASDLTQILREGKGYTYGIGSGFQGSDQIGPFAIGSSVRSNVTLESLQLIKSIVEGHGSGFDAGDLDATQGYLLRANAGALETIGAKLRVLRNMSAYGFPADYLTQREGIVREMTIERIRELAGDYLETPMIWLVVGDAKTQLGRLRALGLGDPVQLDRDGNVLN
jgi:zinc protease